MSRAARDAVATLNPRTVPTTVDPAPDGLAAGERAAFVASYAPDGRVSPSVAALVDNLAERDYAVVLIRASESGDAPEWPGLPPARVAVVRKPNIGYDFGSWAVGMDRFPRLARRDRVLLVNDSLVGPFSGMETLLEDFEDSRCDAWGAVRSTETVPHLQSYFLGFRAGVLGDRVLRRFWSNLPLLDDKVAMVWAYELGLNRILSEESYVLDAFIEAEEVSAEGRNPTIVAWRDLMERGFPFVKRQILEHPELAEDGRSVASFVEARFGVDPRAWT